MADKKGREGNETANGRTGEYGHYGSTADRPPRREKKRRRSFGLRIRLTPSTTAVIWRERKKNEKARVKRATRKNMDTKDPLQDIRNS